MPRRSIRFAILQIVIFFAAMFVGVNALFNGLLAWLDSHSVWTACVAMTRSTNVFHSLCLAYLFLVIGEHREQIEELVKKP